ncbi:sterol desaturase family protein [Novosphingobium sp. MMS21-SN21R]|uniref:sterol desaturase family protein n=1 Tax=Novosphingobium sp. MMS21-SN21R TaxID=2969298 RepID=UPI002885C25E|nr:sterol desaturase family protein [Novosphingobium sp. MMS21-SN21R]MDT0506781.1 sterol desaturase family protein [Novosphingobium sp. MMS21-SN21R]
MTPIDIVTYAVPFFVVLVLAEMIWAARRAPEKYEPRDTLTSLALGLGSTIAGALAAGAIYAAAMWLYAHRVATVPPTWWAWALCFVLDDFNYYLFHRSGHRVRWFWASHVNHHTSQHYNLSTALRQTWTGPLAGSFLFRIWPAFVGFHPAMILTVGAANLVYQFWIHTETIGRMPLWFESVFNTPSHHRVHHATNPLYLDRNYAGVFIVWDRMFGTFQREQDDLAIRYGTVKQLGSFHLLHAAFHEWRAMLGDFWRAPWRHKLSYLVRAPGWSHDGSREGSDTIRARWMARLGQGQQVP